MQRSRCWLLLIVLLSGCTTVDDRAPQVGELTGSDCHVSPSGRYLALASAGMQLFDLTQTPPMMVPLQHGGADDGIWLPNDRWFAYTTMEVSGTTQLPTNGWVVDVPNQVITDVTTLVWSEQAHYLRVAAQALRAYAAQDARQRAPDGQHILVGETIETIGGQEVARVDGGIVRACSYGWAPDSSGVYILEFPNRTSPSGTVRLLRVPPPPHP